MLPSVPRLISRPHSYEPGSVVFQYAPIKTALKDEI